MREILFRGKRKDNNEWVYGNYAYTDTNGEQHFIFQNKAFEYEVIPETICQYTGLADNKGIKIFEGDILRYYDDEIQIVEWNKEFSNLMLHTYCKYERKKGRKVVIENSDGWNWLHDYPLNEMSIIGNIYDNPELLKEAKQE